MHVATALLRDIADGDLLFARKEGGMLNRLIGYTDDPFHHCAIVATHDGERVVVEFTFNGCTFRPLDAFVANYDDVAMLRPALGADEANHLARVALSQLNPQAVYAWDELLIVGFAALFRRVAGTKHTMHRGAWLRFLERRFEQRRRHRPDLHICSSYVHEVLTQVIGPSLFSDRPRDIQEWSRPTSIPGPTPLLGPSDLWRAIPAIERFALKSSDLSRISMTQSSKIGTNPRIDDLLRR